MSFQDAAPPFGEDSAVLEVKNGLNGLPLGGGRDAKGCLFDLYSQVKFIERLNLVSIEH